MYFALAPTPINPCSLHIKQRHCAANHCPAKLFAVFRRSSGSSQHRAPLVVVCWTCQPAIVSQGQPALLSHQARATSSSDFTACESDISLGGWIWSSDTACGASIVQEKATSLACPELPRTSCHTANSFLMLVTYIDLSLLSFRFLGWIGVRIYWLLLAKDQKTWRSALPTFS